MKRIGSLLIILMMLSSILISSLTFLVPVASATFDKEVHNFDKIYYDDTVGFNKIGTGALILAVTFKNASISDPNFREIDSCEIEFIKNPLYFSIEFQENLETIYDDEGNIIYEESGDGYVYLRKSVVDNYLPSIKKIASNVQYSTITFQGVKWYRIYVPDFNREYTWKEYQYPILNENWYTWGSSESISFETKAMYVKQVAETTGHLEFDFKHPTDNSGQTVAFNKSYLASKGINNPYFEWNRWKSIPCSYNNTHYFINPEHFSWIGIHEASSGTTNGTLQNDSSPMTEITRPDSDLFLQWSVSTGTDAIHWEDVDDVDPDDDTTYIVEVQTGPSAVTDIFNHTSNFVASYPNCQIDSVIVQVRASTLQVSGSNQIAQIIRTHNTNYSSPAVVLTTSYVNYSYDWTINPNTVDSWTVQDIDDCEFGVWTNIITSGVQRNYCTQVFLTIYFNRTYSFTVTRTAGATSESNNFTFLAPYAFVGTNYLKVPVSNSVRGIVEVWDYDAKITATGVNDTSDLVNGTYWYNPANQYVLIGANDTSNAQAINWSVNCSYGSTFSVSPPTYLPVGHPFEFIGLIKNSSGVAISGYIATTRIVFTNGTNALTPVEHNCTNGNIFVTMATTSLEPGHYLWQISFVDVTTGVTFKKGGDLSIATGTYGYYDATLYLSFYDNSTGTDSHSPAFTFYDPNTGTGLDTTWLRLYVSEDTSFTEDERVWAPDYETYTGQTLYYKVLDYFGNKIYPLVASYSTVTIQYTNQFIDIPIQMYTLAVKNMNHSIVKFELHNGSRAYIQYLFPYEPFYWYLFPGNYSINVTYYNAVTGAVVDYHNTSIDIDNHTYYWIEGYDLRDIVLEVRVTNSSIGGLVLTVTTDISLVNSTVTNITTTIISNLTATESNITTLIHNIWGYINITDSVVDWLNATVNVNILRVNTTINYINDTVWTNFTLINTTINDTYINIMIGINLSEANLTSLNLNVWTALNLTDAMVTYLNNTMWANFTFVNATINTINNKLTIDFDMLNVTVDYINNTVWTQFTILNTSIGTINNSIISVITLSEVNLTALNNNIWNSINLTDAMVTYFNNTIWSNISFINATIHTMNNTLVLDIGFVNSTIDYINTTIWNEITAVNSSVGRVSTTIINIWNDQNVSFGNLTNRSTVVFSFYNTNEGLGLDRETMKVYVNGSRLINNIYYCYNESNSINLTIKDYYNTTLYTNNFTINAPFTFIDLGITFHYWLFGNKNDDPWFISILKRNATRWWEKGIVPYGQTEFMIPSGNYTLRVYNSTYYEIYNVSGLLVANSRIYVIHGTNLTLIASGLSTVRGQLLELQTDLDYALMPDAVIWSYNPPIIMSVFDRVGMGLGTNVWKVCPAFNVVATTRNETTDNWINSTMLIPSNGTVANGTITLLEDTLYIFGNSSVTWVNITYTDNGTLLQNTTYIPGRLPIFGENLTINATVDVYVMRETRYNQLKKFYWDIYNSTTNPGHISGRAGYHRAGIEVQNVLTVPLYDVAVYIGYSDKTTPDENTVRVSDVANDGALLERGENFKSTGDGVEFRITGCVDAIPSVNASSSRNFVLSYYSYFLDSYIYDDGQVYITSFETGKKYGNKKDFYNYFDDMYLNDRTMTFRGSIYYILNLDKLKTEIDEASVIVYDLDNNVEVDKMLYIVGDSFLIVTSKAVGDISPGGGRNFGVYFLEQDYPGADPEDFKLGTPIVTFYGLPITPFFIIFLILLIPMSVGLGYMVIKRRYSKLYVFLVVISFLIMFVLFIIQAKGG